MYACIVDQSCSCLSLSCFLCVHTMGCKVGGIVFRKNFARLVDIVARWTPFQISSPSSSLRQCLIWNYNCCSIICVYYVAIYIHSLPNHRESTEFSLLMKVQHCQSGKYYDGGEGLMESQVCVCGRVYCICVLFALLCLVECICMLLNGNGQIIMRAPLPVCSAKLSIIEPG